MLEGLGIMAIRGHQCIVVIANLFYFFFSVSSSIKIFIVCSFHLKLKIKKCVVGNIKTKEVLTPSVEQLFIFVLVSFFH